MKALKELKRDQFDYAKTQGSYHKIFEADNFINDNNIELIN